MHILKSRVGAVVAGAAAIAALGGGTAIAGNLVGYWIGHRAGPAVFNRPDSRLFKAEYVEKSHGFFEKYGARTIVLARFVPIVRTFAPIVAGAGRMHYRTFVTFNVLGGLLWAVGVTTLGYLLGETIPDIDRYLLPIIAVIILASVAPVAYEVLKKRKAAAARRGGT